MIHVSSQLLFICGLLMINKKMQKMHRLSGPCWQACCLLARGAHLAKARHGNQETIHQLTDQVKERLNIGLDGLFDLAKINPNKNLASLEDLERKLPRLINS